MPKLAALFFPSIRLLPEEDYYHIYIVLFRERHEGHVVTSGNSRTFGPKNRRLGRLASAGTSGAALRNGTPSRTSNRRHLGGTKPLRVFAALAAAKTDLDGRGEMGSTVGPQLWNFQVERLDVGVMASPETGWEA